LTGLVNRRTFTTQVRAMLAHKQMFALAVADLDHFKAVNDKHGHEAGDRALRLFAQVAHDALGEEDILARWGGEEFVIVLPGLDRHAGVSILERIRERLANAHGGGAPRFTASFGLTDTTVATSLEMLMHVADAGLYTSKQTGRDRVTIGEPPPDEPDPNPATYEGDPRTTPETRYASARPLLHEATDEEDPSPSGFEIR
jgi:diguanylate cyclase (GGDEF)-like protein